MNKRKMIYNIKRTIIYIGNISVLLVMLPMFIIELLGSFNYKQFKKRVNNLVIYGECSWLD
jgi:hypothetical protein